MVAKSACGGADFFASSYLENGGMGMGILIAYFSTEILVPSIDFRVPTRGTPTGNL